jgi:Ca2+-binding EF-hand superfamily protein
MNTFDLRFRNLTLVGLLCAFSLTPAMAASEAPAAEAPSFKTYDSNDDGMISMAEYLAQGGKEPAFQASDTNKDNSLSIDEFVKANAPKDTQGKSNY